MSTDPAWFYESAGERVGPVSTAELVTLSREGRVRAETLVWRDGLENWIPFSTSELAAAGPPPVPTKQPAGPPPVPAPILSAAIIPFVPRTAVLRPGFRPRIRFSLERGWRLMTSNFWPIVGCFTLSTLILSIASQFFIPIFFLMYPLMGGLYWYMLRQVRGQDANMEMLFEGFRRQFGPLAIVNLIISVIAMVFMVPLIIVVVAGIAIMTESQVSGPDMVGPAAIFGFFGGMFLVTFVISLPLMILGQVGNFATLLILDCELKAKEAMSLAWTATKPFLIKFILFMLVNAALSMVGVLALYVGMFVTGAWSSLALVYLYEDAFGEGNPTQPTLP